MFVLTGAGISAESGIPTFRDDDGLWRRYRIEDVAMADSFARNPGLVWTAISEMRRKVEQAQPNSAHRALAQLEGRIGDWLFLCTQNVDDLHERGGSRWVVHLHGSVARSRCSRDGCGEAFLDSRAGLSPGDVERCRACGAPVRPDLVLFGEVPHELMRVHAALAVCDLFVAVGTSGAVEPAASFAAGLGRRPVPPRRVYVGPMAPHNAADYDECRLGTACEAMPNLFRVNE
ncbi:MAG: Sir2 family NAD-dependent protein deacetylase [Myxococcales bacterium]